MRVSKESLCSSCVAIHPIMNDGKPSASSIGDRLDSAENNDMFGDFEQDLVLRSLRKNGGCSKCIATLEMAVNKNTEELIAAMTKADLASWIDRITDNIRTEPNAEEYYKRGLAYMKLANSKNAIADFQKAVELDPANSHYRELLERVKGDVRKTGEIMADKMDAQAYLERGDTYVKSMNTDNAISAFREAFLLNPELTRAREMLGACYFDKGLWHSNNGDNANAIAEYKKAICIAESMGDIFTKEQLSTMYFNLGAAYSQVGAWQNAYVYFGKAKDLNPVDTDCQDAYKKAQINRDRHKEFRITIPSEGYEYAKRGKQYLQKGDYDNALSDFNDAIILAPKEAVYYENRGEVSISKRDYDKAIADFTTAISISPSYNAYTQRGNAYEAKKDHDKAITDFTGAINISPKSYDAYKKRGAVYEAKGEHDKAKADFAQAEQLQKKEAVRKKRNLIIGLVIATVIIGLIIKCAVIEAPASETATARVTDTATTVNDSEIPAPSTTKFRATHKIKTNDGSNLRLRSEPSTTGTRIDSLDNGSDVQVLETGEKFVDSDGNAGNWVRVRTQDGQEGWCFGAYLTKL